MKIIRTQAELDSMINTLKTMTISSQVPFPFRLTIRLDNKGDYIMSCCGSESCGTFSHDTDFPQSIYGTCMKIGALFTLDL